MKPLNGGGRYENSGLTLALIVGFLADAVGLNYRAGQLYVAFKPGRVTLTTDSTGFTRCGISYLDSVNWANNCLNFRRAGCAACDVMVNDYLVIFPESSNVFNLTNAYLADTNVRWAEPNYLTELSYTPNDSFFLRPPGGAITSYQWPLDSNHLQMEKAWDITKGDSNVVVAILDRGAAWRHPDLEPNVWINAAEDINHNGRFDTAHVSQGGDINYADNDGDGFADNVIGFQFCEGEDPDPEPNSSCFTEYSIPDLIHGAWVWSNVGAKTDNNLRGVAGVAFNCRVMPVGWGPSNVELNEALYFVLQMRRVHNAPAVVNMSFVGGNQTTKDLLDSLYNRGVVLVAAAHNNNRDTLLFPANYPKVIAVAGTDTGDVKSPTSNYNVGIALSAPAYNYMATYDIVFELGEAKPTNYVYTYFYQGQPLQGNSFSAPQVAGVAALLKSIYPNMTPTEIRAKLRSSTDSIKYRTPAESLQLVGKLGTGRLNAFKAVTFFGNIPNAAAETTLTGTVYVSGDITVRFGQILRIAEGTVLRFYPGDVMKSGEDINKTEIIVEAGGKLIIEGVAGNPVKLVSFRKEPDSAATDDWQGIRVLSGGAVKLSHCIIRHAHTGISMKQPWYADTLLNVRIGRCKMFGIRVDSTASFVIRNCRVDSVNTNPGGYGIYLVGTPSGNTAKLIRDTISACYYGIYLQGSTTPIESCLVQAGSGAFTSNTGIVNSVQAALGVDLAITAATINGYFSGQHFDNSTLGRAKLTSCDLISTEEPSRSPYGIKNLGSGAVLKSRKTKVLHWGNSGVKIAHNGNQQTDLGIMPSDSGFNSIYTSKPTVDEITGKPILWWYVYDVDCGASCTGDTTRAEWNYWEFCPPPPSRFWGKIDRNPCMLTAPPKIAVGGGDKGTIPRSTELLQNYPNPFNPTTMIQFNLEKPEKVNLEIFNILGQKVRTMVPGEELAAGPYTFLWDGKDDKGRSLSSGMYLYRLQTSGYSKSMKMSLVK